MNNTITAQAPIQNQHKTRGVFNLASILADPGEKIKQLGVGSY
jgi:hypothetical protein